MTQTPKLHLKMLGAEEISAIFVHKKRSIGPVPNKLVVIHLPFDQEVNQPEDEGTIRPWPNLEPKISLLSQLRSTWVYDDEFRSFPSCQVDVTDIAADARIGIVPPNQKKGGVFVIGFRNVFVTVRVLGPGVSVPLAHVTCSQIVR
jgi:hypothetical protein